MKKRLAIGGLIFLLAALPAAGQAASEPINATVNAHIRAEAEQHSRLMHTLHMLCDVFSPRLTGTPQLKAAQEWALKELTSYGLQNAHLEAWDFGQPGWQNEILEARVIAPYKDALVCEAMAWTPSTRGIVRAAAFHLVPPVAPTQAELEAYLASVRAAVKNKIVLTGPHTIAPVNFRPAPLRLSDDEAKAIYAPRPPSSTTATTAPDKLTPLEISDAIDRFLKANDALLRVHDAREPHGVIRAVINRSRDITQFIPTVVMRNEDYGRITRILADGVAVELEFNIVNRLFPEGRTQYNAIAEIPGTDKKDELVMLGAHIDSHHLATGATDDAVGCAVMMEAVRILQALNLKPRRTIRIALWSGEEQRVMGSQAYVKEHFGSAENPKPAFDRLSGYFNLDTGTGRIRGMRVFGPAEAGDVLRQILAPFADADVVGAGTYSNRTAPGSDHAAFSVNGLPGIYVDQDPLEYGAVTWHTSLDTYERIHEPDAKQAAMVMASAVWHLAMREERLPRFSKEQMPARKF
ncbi:MAG: M20/M25/M40 family metallo-hydrolase [Blastocatellia bacterium]